MPNWTLKRSKRRRTIQVSVRRDGSVVVTAPIFESLRAIEMFVLQHDEWIRKSVEKMSKFKDDTFLPQDRRSYLAYKEKARALVHELLAEYAPRYGFPYKRVAIKNMRRNWGSCSSIGNLNFNYKLVLLPRELAAYVVVHELCHLKVFGHSADFWSLVAQQMPEYKRMVRDMRRYHA